MKTTSIKIVLDKRYENTELNSITYPIRIRITHGRIQQYYSTGKRSTVDDFELLVSQKRPKRLNETFQLVDFARVRAEDITKTINPFNFETFRKKYLNEYGSDNVYAAFIDKENELLKDKKLKTASGYKTARNSFSAFKKTLKYTDITPRLLKDYERWFLARGVTKDRKNTYTTLGIYMRYLRHVLNKAIADGLMQRENYPFGRYGYKIVTGRNIKKACTLEDIAAIMKYIPTSDTQERARDFWLLSYFCNGINFKDLLELRNNNIKGEYIIFTRAKTEYKDKESIQIYISGPIRQLLNKYAIRNVNTNALLFPILSDAEDASKLLKERENFIRTTNKYMRAIAKELNIDKPLTTYYARHSYATILKRQGVSVEQISEALGHADAKTTRNYLDSFESETIKKTAEMLIPKMG